MMNAHKNAMSLTEENVKLKQYIEELNKECLDLQASLFEEANKIAQDAYLGRHNAEKRAKEIENQNNVLKSEVQSLKQLLRLQTQENEEAMAVRRSFSGWPSADATATPGRMRRFGGHRRNPSATACPKDFVGSFDNRRRSSSCAVVHLVSQEPASRKSLFEALTQEIAFADGVCTKNYEEFVNWIEGGCILRPIDADVATNRSSSRSPRTAIVYSQHQQRRDRTSSDVSDTILDPIVTENRSSERDSVFSVTPAPPPPPPPQELTFLYRLMRDDIEPALEFADEKVSAGLKSALCNLGVEMEPLSPGSVDMCPLVPGRKAKYTLNLEIEHEDGSKSQLSSHISSCARERIATVTDLFQYLTLIRRGLTGTPTSPPASPQRPTANGVIPSDDAKDRIRRHQFANVQKRRLAITLARLGYGLPLME